jgi:hypothetical protein
MPLRSGDGETLVVGLGDALGDAEADGVTETESVGDGVSPGVADPQAVRAIRLAAAAPRTRLRSVRAV